MPDNLPRPSDPGEFLLYVTEDGQTRIEVRMEGETVWLPQKGMAELFQTTKQNVSLHIQNVFDEGELDPAATVKQILTVQTEGSRQVQRAVEYYNLDVIISVGYRVKSQRGTQFRIWATQRLREYLVKGFTMDDERLKRGGGGNYFDELLSRIRDIRSSERVFWRKVLDIYATSIDYDASAEASLLFFKTVQNKMHWAAHGQTAAEVVHRRADSTKPNMGLTSWAGDRPRKTDVSNFLRLSDRDVLQHAGKISHEAAVAKAEGEFKKFHQAQAALPQPVDQQFEATLNELKKIEGQKKSRPTAPPRKKPPQKKRRKPNKGNGE